MFGGIKLENIKGFINQLKILNVRGRYFYNFLLEKGEGWNSKSVSQENQQIQTKYYVRAKPKACFYNAQQLTVFSKGEFEYYEGYAINGLIGIPFEHAWNVKDGKVIDTSWEDGKEYFGVKIPYEWIKEKFYEFAFQRKISDSHLLRYYEEVYDANKNSL